MIPIFIAGLVQQMYFPVIIACSSKLSFKYAWAMQLGTGLLSILITLIEDLITFIIPHSSEKHEYE